MDNTRKPSLDKADMHVLVVDDEPFITEEILEFLADEGISAMQADSAESAVQTMQQSVPGAVTVVLSDMKMSGQDGLWLAMQITTLASGGSAAEFVLMSGHGTTDLAAEALRARVFDFVPKPLKLAELAGVLRRAHEAALARRQTHAQTHTTTHTKTAAHEPDAQPAEPAITADSKPTCAAGHAKD